MDQFIIEGGAPLRGEITPAGNKNAALPLLAACLLTDEPVLLHNLPEIRDVLDMRSLIESMGTQVEEMGNKTWRLCSMHLRPGDLDPDLCRRIRASMVFLIALMPFSMLLVFGRLGCIQSEGRVHVAKAAIAR